MRKPKKSIFVSADTTLEAHKVQVQIIRRMTPSQRARAAFELSDNTRRIMIAGIKKQFPHFSKQRIMREVLRRSYGDELFREIARAKRWRP